MKRSQQGKSAQPSSKLESLDRKLVHLLAERSKLLGQTARERKGKDLSFVDPEHEKQLWAIWRQGVESEGMSERLLRRVFSLVNSLAYEQAERREDWAMPLHPKRAAVDIELPGPADTVSSRLWLVLSATLGWRLQVTGAVQNDDLIELVKAGNQAGAGMRWDEAGVNVQGKGLEFDQASIFAGHDPLNFYCMLAVAMARTGVCRLNGGTRLKSESMQSVHPVVQAFGARMVSLVPGSEGLPVRLEASGQIPAEVRLPEEAPQDLVQVLLGLAPLWLDQRSEFSLYLPSGMECANFGRATHILSQVGVAWEQDGNRVTFWHGTEADIPEEPDLTLDPVLCGYALALPLFNGGRVRLHGQPPSVCPEWTLFNEICRQTGLTLSLQAEQISAKPEQGPVSGLDLDCRSAPALGPLALALAVASTGQCVLRMQSGQDLDLATHILTGLGLETEQKSAEELFIRRAAGRQEEPLAMTVPNPFWGLGLALISLTGAQITLKNPGMLTSLWPQFWPLFKHLPHPTPQDFLPGRKQEETAHVQKRRRRIVE